MAPTTEDKRVLTFDDLDDQTALELPERELMCASSCGGLLTINATVCIQANVNVGLLGGGCATSCSS